MRASRNYFSYCAVKFFYFAIAFVVVIMYKTWLTIKEKYEKNRIS